MGGGGGRNIFHVLLELQILSGITYGNAEESERKPFNHDNHDGFSTEWKQVDVMLTP